MPTAYDDVELNGEKPNTENVERFSIRCRSLELLLSNISEVTRGQNIFTKGRILVEANGFVRP